jgi:hypothetical protein
MLDAKTVHKSIDQYTAAQFADVPVVYTNQDDTVLSQGEEAWMKQKVIFRENRQFELGNTSSSRNWGVVVITIFVRKGTGSLVRDTLYDRVRNAYRSRMIGGATFLNVQPMRYGENENWCLSAYQIPFYFNSI